MTIIIPWNLIDLYDLDASPEICKFIGDVVATWLNDECYFGFSSRNLPENHGLVGQDNDGNDFNLVEMLAERKTLLDDLKAITLFDLYLRMINSESFIQMLKNNSNSFFEDLNGLKTLELLNFIRVHIPADEHHVLVSGDTFCLTLKMMEILTNPRVNPEWCCSELVAARDSELVVLEEDVDDLSWLISQAINTEA